MYSVLLITCNNFGLIPLSILKEIPQENETEIHENIRLFLQMS